MGLQTALWILLSRWLRPDGELAFLAFGYGGVQLFVLASRIAELREASARQDLARAHAELALAHAGQAEAQRTRERLRIARELHDSLGHQLTSLHLGLELVANTSGTPHADAVERSRRSLGSGITGPRVYVEVPMADDLKDAARAHCLFRCAQEGLTNALRHAQAERVWLELSHAGTTWALVVRDDGRSALPGKEGSGLLGARERVAELGGSLEAGPRAGGGWQLRAVVPEAG